MPHFPTHRSPSESGSPEPPEEEEPPRPVRATLEATTPVTRESPLVRPVIRRSTDGGAGFGASSQGAPAIHHASEELNPRRLTFTPRGNAELQDLAQLPEAERCLILLGESQLLVPRTTSERHLPSHWRAASSRIIGSSPELSQFFATVRAVQSRLCELTGEEDGLLGSVPTSRQAALLQQRISAILSAHPYLRGFCERLHADHELLGRNRPSSA